MLRASSRDEGRPHAMLYAGLDLSRKRLDFCLLDQLGKKVEVGAAPRDADGLRGLAARIGRFREPVVAAIESMNGARFVHDQLELAGWRVEIADAVKAKVLAPLACKPDRIDAWAAAGSARPGAEHRYVPLLVTAPGIGWVLAYTIAAEIGDISRFATPTKLTGYTGLCPRVYQSGQSDRRGALAKNGPRYLRWALIEATMHASRHPLYHDRYQHTKQRLGKQRGAKVAQIDLARRLAEAIWHMLTRNQPFAKRHGPPGRLTAHKEMHHRKRDSHPT